MCGENFHRVKAIVQRNHHARMMMDLKQGDTIDVGSEKYNVTGVTSYEPGVSKTFEFVVANTATNKRGTGRLEHGSLSVDVTETINHGKDWLTENHKLSSLISLKTEKQVEVQGLLF